MNASEMVNQMIHQVVAGRDPKDVIADARKKRAFPKRNSLVDCIMEFKNDPDIFKLKEAQVKRSVIERILVLLGWDMDNYNEASLEHPVETKELDYALLINKKNKVFIEAKRPNVKLKEKEKEQIFNYSVQLNPDLAILTNGISWWFYLPRAEGAWNDRKFYAIDILEQEIEDIVDKFDRLLSRENVASGKAVQHAESMLKSLQREKIIKERLPEAWNNVITEPHELLVEILIETVEDDCDFKPENNEILEFIHSHHEKWLLSRESGQEVPTTNHPNSKTARQTKNQTEKPKRMQIGKKNYVLKYDYEIFVNTANWLIDKGALKSSDCPLKVNPKAKLNYISNEIENNYPQDWTKLENGLYIYKNLQRNQSLQNAKKLLEHYEYDPEMLKVEYTDILKFEDHRTSQKRATMQTRTEVAEFRHRVLLININRQFREGASLDEVYEATRFAWKISKSRAKKAEVILATYQGEIKAAFVTDEWLEATPENFPGRCRKTVPGRFGFIGREASPDIQELYVGKRVPGEFRKRGVANPIRYVNC